MQIVPGVLLSILVSLTAFGLQWVQKAALDTVWMEGLPMAVVLGMVIRFCWKPGPRWEPGIQFMSKRVLEFAIVLLGAALDAALLASTPVFLIVATFGLVALTIGAGYGFGRLFGLNHQLALLVASGNAICGNSAIAAIAPAIEAEEREIVLAISFTAVLGIVVVVLLPYLVPLLGLDFRQYGILAGWSVYAVPQVLAATLPISLISGQMGTLVKLLRVLMLGPVVLFFGWLQHRGGGRYGVESGKPRKKASFLPWFLVGFALCAFLRSTGVISPENGDALRTLSGWLTIGAMASLGLLADVRGVARSGGRVAATALVSLAILICAGLALLTFVQL